MLTKEHAIFELDRNQVKPDRLTTKKHAPYVAYADQMLSFYRQGIGKTRHELHLAVERIFANEQDCPPRRIDAFCKLLDEDRVSKFDTDRQGLAAALRCKVFGLAGNYHPLVEHKDQLFEHDAAEAKQEIARKLGLATWGEIEPELFADVFEFNRLISFTGYEDARALLARYNVAQVQTALFNATRLVLWARSDFQRIVTHAKLAHLLIDIKPPAGKATEYTIILDGPASVLRETRRYGASMAKFLPALLSCENWRMRAEISLGRFSRQCFLELDSHSGLKSPMPRLEEFDSAVEEGFAKKWGSEPRDGWTMERAAGVLQSKQTIFIPDFVFQQVNGRKVYLEIVGFWTPEYIHAKVEKLKLFESEHIILAVAESIGGKLPPMPQEVIIYKSALKLNDVLAVLAREATRWANTP